MRATERALAADPTSLVVLGNASTNYYGLAGRHEEATVMLEEAVRRDPLYTGSLLNLGTRYLQAGRFDEAAERFRAALELSPGDVFASRSYGFVLLELGQIDAAREKFQVVVEALGNPPKDVLLFDAFLAHYGGEADRAASLMQQFEQQYGDLDPNACAIFYALRNLPDEAFAIMERAYQARTPTLRNLWLIPSRNNLHDDPRWDPFWAKVGLPASAE